MALTLVSGRGVEMQFGGSVTFFANDAQLSKNIVVTGKIAAPLQNLTMSFSGTAAGFYTTPQAGFPTPVRSPKNVRLTVLPQPQEVYMGTMNKAIIVFSLSALPTVISDIISVTFTESPNFVFNRSGTDPVGQMIVKLTKTSPTGAVMIEGLLPGTITLANFITVAAVPSQEYLNNIALLAPIINSIIKIRPRLFVTCVNYVANFFTSQTRTFNFTLPQIPAKGVLTLTPRLAGGNPYPIAYSPTTLVFSNLAGSQTWATLKITADATVLASATFELAATGSTDFNDIPFSSPISVIDARLVVVSGVPALMYPGSINTVPVTLSISQPPVGNLTVTLAPTPGSFLGFTPDSVVFNSTSPLDLTLYLRATNYQVWPANFTMTLLEYPTPWFIPSTTPSVQIKAPDSVTATLSTFVVYQGQPLNIAILLSTAPTQDLFLSVVFKKNQTGTGKSLLLLSQPTEVTVPLADLNLLMQTTSGFTATAQFSPLSVEVSFLISGPSAKTFQPQELLPKFIIIFAPLRKMFVFAPLVMYVGLVANVTVELEKIPDDAGSQVKIQAIPDAMLGVSSQNFIWTTASTGLVMQLNPPCVPLSTGLGNIIFSITLTSTVAYEPKVRNKADGILVTAISITVKKPTVIGLTATPANVFFGALNAFTISVTIGSDPLTTDDDVNVMLTTNGKTVAMVPATGMLQMPSTAGIFTLYSTAPEYVYFNLSFTSKLNRFVLDPAAVNVTVHFRPLKPIFVTPPLSQFIVLQPVDYFVYLDERPEPGHSLVVELIYSGSLSNVLLPASTGWTSAPCSLIRQLTASGQSTTTVQLLSVKFSGDPQYNMTQFDWPMKFDPLLNLGHNFPTSAFYNRSIAGLKITTEKQMNVTVTFSTAPVNVLLFTPPAISFLPTDVALFKSVTFRPILIPAGFVTVKFALTGSDVARST